MAFSDESGATEIFLALGTVDVTRLVFDVDRNAALGNHDG
jgi:hypothetical protein